MAAGWQNALEEFVRSCEAEVSKLRQSADELDISIRGMKKAAGVATGASAKAIAELIDLQTSKLDKHRERLAVAEIEARTAKSALEVAIAGAMRKSSDGSVRRVSSAWREILSFIADHDQNGASLEEIQTFINGKGWQIKDTAVRSQLSIYAGDDKRFVEALGGGRYRTTEEGIAVLIAGSS